MKLSIVSYLDPTATKVVRELQRKMTEITSSRACLDSWEPHVTIGDGVEVAEHEIDSLVNDIKEACRSISPFVINISGFNSFESRPTGEGEISTKYAIVIDVEVSQDLKDLVRAVDDATKERSHWYQMHMPYHPHVTLAFRDLNEAGYKAGLEYLNGKTIQLTSLIDHVALVEKLPDSDTEFTRIPL